MQFLIATTIIAALSTAYPADKAAFAGLVINEAALDDLAHPHGATSTSTGDKAAFAGLLHPTHSKEGDNANLGATSTSTGDKAAFAGLLHPTHSKEGDKIAFAGLLRKKSSN
jgi:hypothetical protein